MRLILVWLLAMLALAGSPARAALPPRPAGPVLDQAAIIPAVEEAALDARLRAYNAKSGRSVLVVTLPSLDGEDIATYGANLGHAWGVGGKSTDQGLILLIAPNERKLRIEVGYGLEEYMPDALASRIVREAITPRFKAGDYGGGVAAGTDAIIAQLDRDPADAKAIAEAASAAAVRESKGDQASPVSVVFWIVLMLFFMRMFGRRRRGFQRSGIDPGIVLWGLSEVLHHAGRNGGGGGGGGWSGGGDSSGGFGGFGGGDFGGGGASGDW